MFPAKLRNGTEEALMRRNQVMPQEGGGGVTWRGAHRAVGRAVRETEEPFQCVRNQKSLSVSLFRFPVTSIHALSPLLVRKELLSTSRPGTRVRTGNTTVSKTACLSLFQNPSICGPKGECPLFKVLNSLSTHPNKSL